MSGHVYGRLRRADQLNTIDFASKRGKYAFAFQTGKRLTDTGMNAVSHANVTA